MKWLEKEELEKTKKEVQEKGDIWDPAKEIHPYALAAEELFPHFEWEEHVFQTNYAPPKCRYGRGAKAISPNGRNIITLSIEQMMLVMIYKEVDTIHITHYATPLSEEELKGVDPERSPHILMEMFKAKIHKRLIDKCKACLKTAEAIQNTFEEQEWSMEMITSENLPTPEQFEAIKQAASRNISCEIAEEDDKEEK